MTRIATARLVLRDMVPDDASFVLELVNDPSWLRFIGDRGIHTVEAAAAYIEDGPMAMYRRLGFGLWLVALKDGTPIGMCGLIKREALEDVDLGFAFLPAYGGQGYAFEAASATLAHAAGPLGLGRIVAIVMPQNERSTRLLARLGFEHAGPVQTAADGPMLRLYARAFSAARSGS